MFGNSSFPKAHLLPLIAKLGEFLKLGFEKSSENIQINRSDLATILLLAMEDWNPKIKGKSLLDAETKKHCANFLAGVALNMTQNDTKETKC